MIDKSPSKTKTVSMIIAFGLGVGFSSAAYAQIGSEMITVPLNFDSSVPMIEIEVEGKPARVVYDSGASVPVIFEQSFPELLEKAVQQRDARAFGGDQTIAVTQVNSVKLSWNDIALENETIALADYKSTGLYQGDPSFFEGLIFSVRIADDKHESITVFDAPNKQILHLPIGQKVEFEKSEKFKLKRKDDWKWYVKMPVILEGETKKRTLNLFVDTGAAHGLILNRNNLPVQNNSTGYKEKSAGLAGVSNSTYGGRTQIFIGEDSVLINTDIDDSLPSDNGVDGFVGWGFLSRFRTAFDFNKGRMTIDLKDADLTDDKPRGHNFRAQGLPMPDWSGMRISDVGVWSSSGLQAGDILTSIDGTRLSSTAMYSVLGRATDEATLCWKRGAAPETCASTK